LKDQLSMHNPVLVGEKAEEYKRLYAECTTATTNARAVLKSKGMDSDEFAQAVAAVTELWRRLRELQGMAGKH
jgi:hypothetical protein